ncbi:MAG: DUF2157 domain-containing protein [Bacteroidota bacterium]|nr:DUF2157 domain-containing protein [Bacteroidota bacterium]
MSKILKELPELTEAGVISDEAAERIRSYYTSKSNRGPNAIVLVFGILGALLVGLGVVLIIAHNWDDLARPTKIVYALLPLLAGQLVCGYTLLKKPRSQAWRESGAVLVFFAVAASISIVSQVYNIPGDLSGFMLTWMLLSIPVIYVMRSAMTSLLVIVGITVYACTVSYFSYPTEIAWYYWLMLALVVPFFFMLAETGRRNFEYFHRWFLAVSLIISLNVFNESDSVYMFVAYMSMFSLFILLGETTKFSGGRIANNAFLVTGSLGSAVLLLFLSFRWTWTEIAREIGQWDEGFFVAIAMSLLAGGALVHAIRTRGVAAVHPKAYLFLVFIMLFELGKVSPVVTSWLVSLLVLAVAVITTWRGAGQNNMLVLNYGLLILSALIICRFFDTDMSFVVRGILFVIVGSSFFGANYWVLRKRKLQNS